MNTTKLRTLHGTTLTGTGGEKIGKISDVYEPARDGGSWFATVHTGIFGTGSSFVPLTKATETDHGLSVPYSKAFVKQAPHIADDAEISQAEETQIVTYYGLDETPVPAPSGPSARAGGARTSTRPARDLPVGAVGAISSSLAGTPAPRGLTR